jgi:hypothetical protein
MIVRTFFTLSLRRETEVESLIYIYIYIYIYISVDVWGKSVLALDFRRGVVLALDVGLGKCLRS